jgi:HAMP domain-containing protein
MRKKENNQFKERGIRISIFIKLLLILLMVSVVPTVLSFFLTISTYQNNIETGVIKKYLPRGNVEVEKELFYLQREIRFKTISLLLIIVLITVIICFFISRGFTKPIRALFKGTLEVARGNLEVRVPKYSEDEIGELVEAFNKMIEETRRSKKELEEAKNILEIKVRARTKELQELTESLEEKVASRTKRLEEKIKDLEKFKKLALEQQAEIERLKKELETKKL